METKYSNLNIPSPCYVCDEALLEKNLQRLNYVQEQAGIDIILALKGFSMWSTFDLVSRYLKGATASSVWEAKLALEMRGEIHAYSPAFKQQDVEELCDMVKHISFNSLSQLSKYAGYAKRKGVSVGLRINPENREAATELYDPCAPGSRLGVLNSELENIDMTMVDGFHVHNLCESDSFAAKRTLQAIEEKFASYLNQITWLNLGGGHLITGDEYDVEHLIQTLNTFKQKYPHLRVILEPGSAIAWQAGDLICEVVDIVHNDIDILMLDISATAHMPDVLEMPYRPMIAHSAMAYEKANTYQLGGNSCLAGDVIGQYSFDQKVNIGDKLVFEDMLHYTMVKTTFFNGVQHPSIGIIKSSGEFELVKQFQYEEFKARLS